MLEAWVYRLAAVVVKLARTLRPGATMDAFCDARHSRLRKPGFSLVILIRLTIKFILRSSKNRLTGNLIVAK
jgi:hypothetical protein